MNRSDWIGSEMALYPIWVQMSSIMLNIGHIVVYNMYTHRGRSRVNAKQQNT